jgi:hypothetical protein
MRRYMKCNLNFICLVLFFTTSLMAENKTPLYGIWSGTIGKAKINACFQAANRKYYTNGSYYYLKYRQPIKLTALSDTLWAEPDSSCKWVIETNTDTRVLGKWVNQSKNISLPIELSYLGTCKDDDQWTDNPCCCDLFNSPIEKMPPITVDTVKGPGYKYYRKLKAESGNITMEWFELCGGGEVRKKINQFLCKGFPKNSSDAKCFFECFWQW